MAAQIDNSGVGQNKYNTISQKYMQSKNLICVLCNSWRQMQKVDDQDQDLPQNVDLPLIRTAPGSMVIARTNFVPERSISPKKMPLFEIVALKTRVNGYNSDLFP